MQRREFIGGCVLASLVPACSSASTSSATAASPEAERVLEEASSEFNHVVVTQQGRVRKMYFEIPGGAWLLQSTYDLDAPTALHHEVFQTMVAGLLLQPEVRRMCMIGLGGAQLSNYLWRRLPELELDVVEICPAVVTLAKRWFDVPDDPRYRVQLGDGRVFVEGLAAGSVDLLVHDAYRGHSIPLHLRSQEFFAACARALAPGGVLVANMHKSSARYPVDRATMATVFRHVHRFTSESGVQTTVVATMAEQAASLAELRAAAERLQPSFDLDLRGLAERVEIDEDGWDSAAVVHDDFDATGLDEAARRHNLSCTPRCADDR